MSRPRTEAGRKLLAEMERLNFASGAKADPTYAQRIAAIEDEATEQGARLREVVKRAEALIWDIDHNHPTTTILRQEQALRDALLAGRVTEALPGPDSPAHS